MQRRPVDLLRALFDRVLRGDPNNDELLTVGKLVEALEHRSRTDLKKATKAVFDLGSFKLVPLASFSDASWIVRLLAVSFTGDRKIFDDFLARYAASLARHDAVASAWTNLAAKVADLAAQDAFDPKLAAENILDWTVG